jgi:hypothetical protein
MEPVGQPTVEKKKRSLTKEHIEKMQAARKKKKESVNAPQIIVSSPKPKFFGEADRTRDGRIKSDYPGWYQEQHLEDLRESIAQQERALEQEAVPPERKGQYRERLKQEKERLEQIEASKPIFVGIQKDKMANIRKEIGQKISDAQYSRSQIERGLINPHEEARRMTEPCIEVKSQEEAEILKECGARINEKGMVTRTEAEKAWKIVGRALGEDITNVEALRRP